MKLTGEIVRELLSYDPFTGKLWWKFRDRKWFSTDGDWKTWNTRFANREAFTSVDGNGYLHGTILGEVHYAHKIIWLYCFNQFSNVIDHDDGNKSNNIFFNLKDGTYSDNSKNQKLRIDNKSSYHGVLWDVSRNKWQVRINVNGKTIHLVRYSSFDKAVEIRKAAETEYKFNPNHGRR